MLMRTAFLEEKKNKFLT